MYLLRACEATKNRRCLKLFIRKGVQVKQKKISTCVTHRQSLTLTICLSGVQGLDKL